jgi:Domain of unknown function (DUF4136)
MLRRAGLAVLALAVAGCVDDVSSTTITGTSVITYHDPGADFGAYRTYAITSKLAVYEEVSGLPVYTFVPAPAIFAAIEANMNARGYVKVATIDPANPPPVPPDADLALNPVVLRAERSAVYPCDWWSWWSYPGYGCNAPWTWVPYTVGTLLLPLADLRNPPPPGSEAAFDVVWSGAAYAVLPPGGSFSAQAAVDAVNQAFAQSPYLQSAGAP